MGFYNSMKSFFGLTAAAGKPTGVPTQSTPLVGSAIKAPKTSQSRAAYFAKSKVGNGSSLTKLDRGLINHDITTYRSGRDTPTLLRDFAISTPDLSASVDAYIRTVVSPEYNGIAKNLDGTFNLEATQALQFLLTRFDLLNNYEEGFSNTPSIRSVSEALTKEFRYYGSAAIELVLDKNRLPVRLQPVSVTTINFEYDKGGMLFPTQEIDGTKVSLDIPTFFYRSIDQDLLTPYANSPMESALQPVLFMAEFLNDLRRVVKQALYPRIQVKLNSKELMQNMPPQYRETPEQTELYLSSVVNNIADHVNNLEPQDALVFMDSIDVNYLSRGNVSLNTELEVLQNIINGKVSTGTKTMPSILGQGSSSNNIASTETLLFMKSAEGVQKALNDILSQTLTLAVRLLGYDVFVEFAFQRIDLRPDSELEAFKTMKQSRILELLSCGFLTDEQASMELTGRLPGPNVPKLSGTMFHKSSGNTIENPYSNTSQSTLSQDITSDAPKNSKSQNGGKVGNV